MPPTKDSGIRRGVWLACIVPFAVVGAGLVYELIPREKAAVTRAPPAAEEVEAPPQTPAVVPQPPPPAPTAAPTATAPLAEGVPEPIPELEPSRVTPQFDPGAMTPDELAAAKSAYRAKLFDDLASREKTLEQEVAAAHRSGDTRLEGTKATTLAYLQQRRAELTHIVVAGTLHANERRARTDAGTQ